jgi:hypothetical protein
VEFHNTPNVVVLFGAPLTFFATEVERTHAVSFKLPSTVIAEVTLLAVTVCAWREELLRSAKQSNAHLTGIVSDRKEFGFMVFMKWRFGLL